VWRRTARHPLDRYEPVTPDLPGFASRGGQFTLDRPAGRGRPRDITGFAIGECGELGLQRFALIRIRRVAAVCSQGLSLARLEPAQPIAGGLIVCADDPDRGVRALEGILPHRPDHCKHPRLLRYLVIAVKRRVVAPDRDAHDDRQRR
jgi:hypothetical protein